MQRMKNIEVAASRVHYVEIWNFLFKGILLLLLTWKGTVKVSSFASSEIFENLLIAYNPTDVQNNVSNSFFCLVSVEEIIMLLQYSWINISNVYQHCESKIHLFIASKIIIVNWN